MALIKHPGYLGITSRGVIAIHADWPMYPAEHGWRVALTSLGQFPRGSLFSVIDDIDECYLLVLGSSYGIKDPTDERFFHVALWREDVQELHREGLVDGAYEITLSEWIERRRKELAGLGYLGPDGAFVPVPEPRVEEFGDDEEALVLTVSSDGLKVTPKGWSALQRRLVAETERLHPSLKLRALPIAKLGQFDSAIREACVLLESRVRTIARSQDYGQLLIERFVASLVASQRFISAQLKVLRGELRTTFKYVRNEFMHNLQELTAPQCYAMLVRLSALFVLLDDVETILASPSPDV